MMNDDEKDDEKDEVKKRKRREEQRRRSIYVELVTRCPSCTGQYCVAGNAEQRDRTAQKAYHKMKGFNSQSYDAVPVLALSSCWFESMDGPFGIALSINRDPFDWRTRRLDYPYAEIKEAPQGELQN